MENEKILSRWGDEQGDLFRVGRRGSHYFIEQVAPAFSPNPGAVTREYVTKREADAFDPDPLGQWEMSSSE